MAHPLGIQLYTLRDEAAKDFPGVIERLGRIGFGAVEVAALHGLRAEEIRRRVEDAGMRVGSLHGMPFGDEAERVFDEAGVLGSPHVVIPAAGPDEFKSAAAVDALAARLNAAGEAAGRRGLSLGYHNHFWEWAPLPDGTPAYERLVAALSPDVVFELDVYWAQTAGRDPLEVLAGLGRRAALLHLKDGPADDPASPMTAAGEGVVDLPAILRAAPEAACFVELDQCATDMWTAVERSHAYLVEQRGGS